MQKVLLFTLILFGIDSIFAATHSLQYVYSGSSGIPNLPEFMTVGLVDGEPFTYYDSNIRREVPRQEWMAKAVYAAYWDQQTQISMNTEPVFKNNIEIAKMRFNQTGGKCFQWMYGCEWDDEIGVTGAVHQYGYDGSDFIALDFRTMTYVAPVMQAIPTKQKWDSNRAELENIKSYFTQECIDWLKKYVSYGKCTLERTVRPEVSLLQKDPSSPVTCHATGFFPKGIVVTCNDGWFSSINKLGHAPKPFKTSVIRPVLKKTNLEPSDLRNYRRISNPSFISKILEKAAVHQLSSVLQKNTANELCQSGFRPNHKTETGC
uniref:MHC class I-like antigen recognition-like domain-containing protein n=1 Tax=Paramormyrops kingsleyae TaxID=1676925 RepID=A0A3B3RZY1_9TELE